MTILFIIGFIGFGFSVKVSFLKRAAAKVPLFFVAYLQIILYIQVLIIKHLNTNIMKKTAIMLAGLALMSCTKEVSSLTPVNFKCTYVEEGTMARGISDIDAILSESQPGDFPLILKSERTGTRYNSTITGTILLPVGNYTITGENKPQKVEMIAGTSSYFTQVPKVSVKDDIEVVPEVSTYNLNAAILSFGVAVDFGEIERATFFNNNGDELAVPFIREGETGLAYAYGDFRQRPLRLRVYPLDKENNEPMDFNLYSSATTDGVQVQGGRYYILHPHAVETGNSGFGINLPDWTGEDLN